MKVRPVTVDGAAFIPGNIRSALARASSDWVRMFYGSTGGLL
jgi:hypothetical protein